MYICILSRGILLTTHHTTAMHVSNYCPDSVTLQAFLIDPYDWRGTLVYIGSMVDLSLKNELFYLGKKSELIETIMFACC